MTTFRRGDPTWLTTRSSLLEDFAGGAIVWDFDGVVADTEPIHRDSYQAVLNDRNYTLPPNYFADLIGLTEPEIWGKIINRGAPVKLDEVEKLTRARREYVVTTASKTLSPSWVVSSIAPEFAQRGCWQVIASNGNSDTIATLLELWGMTSLFANTRGLNKKEIIARAEPTIPRLMIEDNATYLEMGRSSGFHILGVRHSLNISSEFPPCDEIII